MVEEEKNKRDFWTSFKNPNKILLFFPFSLDHLIQFNASSLLVFLENWTGYRQRDEVNPPSSDRQLHDVLWPSLMHCHKSHHSSLAIAIMMLPVTTYWHHSPLSLLMWHAFVCCQIFPDISSDLVLLSGSAEELKCFLTAFETNQSDWQDSGCISSKKKKKERKKKKLSLIMLSSGNISGLFMFFKLTKGEFIWLLGVTVQTGSHWKKTRTRRWI